MSDEKKVHKSPGVSARFSELKLPLSEEDTRWALEILHSVEKNGDVVLIEQLPYRPKADSQTEPGRAGVQAFVVGPPNGKPGQAKVLQAQRQRQLLGEALVQMLSLSPRPTPDQIMDIIGTWQRPPAAKKTAASVIIKSPPGYKAPQDSRPERGSYAELEEGQARINALLEAGDVRAALTFMATLPPVTQKFLVERCELENIGTASMLACGVSEMAILETLDRRQQYEEATVMRSNFFSGAAPKEGASEMLQHFDRAHEECVRAGKSRFSYR